MLNLDPGMLIWTWITFIVLLVLLYRVAWRPLIAKIEERDKAIAEGLKKAELAREEAERMLAEQEQKMTRTHDEIREMLDNSKKMAENSRKELINQAREEAEKIIERGKTDIARERLDAISRLKKDVSNLIVQAASKLIGVSLDEKKHQELIDDSIKKLDQN